MHCKELSVRSDFVPSDSECEVGEPLRANLVLRRKESELTPATVADDLLACWTLLLNWKDPGRLLEFHCEMKLREFWKYRLVSVPLPLT